MTDWRRERKKLDDAVCKLLDLLESLDIKSAGANHMDDKFGDVAGYIDPYIERIVR